MNRASIPAYLALAFLVAGTPHGSNAQVSIDLPSAIERALSNNRNLEQAMFRVEGAAYDVDDARSAFRVRLRPDSQVGFSSEEDQVSYGLTAARRLPPGSDLSIGGQLDTLTDLGDESLKRGSVRVQLQQPLLRNFGSLVQTEPILLASSRYREAQRTYERSRADLVVDVVSSFENILALERQRASDEAFRNRVEKLQQLTQARERQGHTTRVDTLRVELQVGQAESRLEATRDRLFAERRSFAELVGEEPDVTFSLEPTTLFDVSLPELTEAVAIALENRLDYAQVLDNLDDLSRAVVIANRNRFPDLALVSRYEQFGEGEDTSDATDLSEDDWFVGLTLSSDLNRAADKLAIRKAGVEQSSGAKAVEITRVAIARAVQQELSAYRRSRQEYKIAQRNHDLADRRARLARRLFELGRGDNFSVTDAEESFVQAQSAMLVARAELSIATYRLFRELGTVVDYPEELKPTAFFAGL